MQKQNISARKNSAKIVAQKPTNCARNFDAGKLSVQTQIKSCTDPQKNRRQKGRGSN